MKTPEEYYLQAFNKVGIERHGNKPGPIIMTVYSTGHAQQICEEALEAMQADHEKEMIAFAEYCKEMEHATDDEGIIWSVLDPYERLTQFRKG